MKAVADRRTNSIVVTGPEDRVVEVMVGLVSQDAKKGRILPPRTAPAPLPPGTLPGTAPAGPDAPGEKPGARRIEGLRGLDEIAALGENGNSLKGGSPPKAPGFCLFANKDAIL